MRYFDIVYNSMQLENIDITIEDTINLIENKTSSLNPIQEEVVLNFIRAIDYVNHIKKDFNKLNILDYVKQINSYILTGKRNPDYKFRDSSVRIGGTEYTPRSVFDYQIANDLQDIINEPLKVYAYIAKCQLFEDGNKRTALLTANLLSDKEFFIQSRFYTHYKDELIRYYETDDIDRFVYAMKLFIKEI